MEKHKKPDPQFIGRYQIAAISGDESSYGMVLDTITGKVYVIYHEDLKSYSDLEHDRALEDIPHHYLK